jgi:hypothetical protein
MADWTTISSLATGGGTLVLAIATFSSVRSSNRSARVAEQALLIRQQPFLVPSRQGDPLERVRFIEGIVFEVSGHGAATKVKGDNVYMAIALRNAGEGLAVIHGWRAAVAEVGDQRRPDMSEFRAQTRDLYIAPGETGFWQGAIRDGDHSSFDALRAAAERQERVIVDVLYGDQSGGQRTIARFSVSDWPNVEGEWADVVRHWNVDRDDPR